jgi:hypothetical protein
LESNSYFRPDGTNGICSGILWGRKLSILQFELTMVLDTSIQHSGRDLEKALWKDEDALSGAGLIKRAELHVLVCASVAAMGYKIECPASAPARTKKVFTLCSQLGVTCG